MRFLFSKRELRLSADTIELRSNQLTRLISYLYLAVCFAVAVYSVQRGTYTNSDDASELILGKLLAEEGGILSKNWYYSTELRVLNTNLIYSLFFRLTDDWLLVRVLSSAVLYGILLGSYFFMCRVYGLWHYAWLFSPLLVLPISVDYYLFVINGLYYIPHISITFTALGLMGIFLKRKGPGLYLAGAGLFVLSLLAGLGGARQLLILNLPLLAAGLFLFWLYRGEQDAPKAGKFLAGALTAFCGSAIGFKINTDILFQEYSFKKWEVHFSNLRISRVEELLNGLLNEYGFSTGNIFSFSLIRNIVAAVWLLLTVFAIVRGIMDRKKLRFAHTAFAAFSGAAFLVFILLYLFTDMSFADRYWIPITVLSIPLLAGLAESLPFRKIYVKGCGVFFIFVCCLCATCAYRTDEHSNLPSKYQADEQRQISQIAVSEGYSTGYASFWNANVLTELSGGKIDMRAMCNSGPVGYSMSAQDVDQVMPWLQLKRHETERPQGKVFLLLTAGEREKNNWKSNLRDEDLFYSSEHYSAYGYESHEAMVETLYRSYDVSFEDNPYCMEGADVNRCRTLYPGGLSFGPYITRFPGEYEVTITGRNLDLAEVECTFDSGRNRIEIEIAEKTPTKIVYRFSLAEKTSDIETIVKNPSDQYIELHSIHIERK